MIEQTTAHLIKKNSKKYVLGLHHKNKYFLQFHLIYKMQLNIFPLQQRNS